MHIEARLNTDCCPTRIAVRSTPLLYGSPYASWRSPIEAFSFGVKRRWTTSWSGHDRVDAMHQGLWEVPPFGPVSENVRRSGWRVSELVVLVLIPIKIGEKQPATLLIGFG